MPIIIVELIAVLLNSALVFMEPMIVSLAPTVFYAEREFPMSFFMGGVSRNIVSDFYNIMLSFGISLLILKFLKKGFETYTLWSDGDPDADPLQLVVNFVKALAVALTFTVAYGWIADVAIDLLNQLLATLANPNTSLLYTAISNLNLFSAITALVFFICWFLLYVQFLMRGLEMIILRVGMPLACSGLLDSDKGVFRPYMQKFFQNALTVVIQLVLCRLGLKFFSDPAQIFWGIAAMLLALKTPAMLREFMITPSGGSAGNSIYQTVRLAQMAARAVTKV
ncbi:hypothetical protein FACS1894202_11460 [Clostridia bacterium]|nr:hypothetical protein FACS1894202_11460 [Clostridia bacterium]